MSTEENKEITDIKIKCFESITVSPASMMKGSTLKITAGPATIMKGTILKHVGRDNSRKVFLITNGFNAGYEVSLFPSEIYSNFELI